MASRDARLRKLYAKLHHLPKIARARAIADLSDDEQQLLAESTLQTFKHVGNIELMQACSMVGISTKNAHKAQNMILIPAEQFQHMSGAETEFDAHMRNAADLVPWDHFGTIPQFRMQAKVWCKNIFRCWGSINTALSLHEALVKKRWLKKSN